MSLGYQFDGKCLQECMAEKLAVTSMSQRDKPFSDVATVLCVSRAVSDEALVAIAVEYFELCDLPIEFDPAMTASVLVGGDRVFISITNKSHLSCREVLVTTKLI